MSKEHHIDDYFRSTLQSHTVTPDSDVWDRIANQLEDNQKNKAIFWKRFTIAASIALILGLSIGIGLFLPTYHPEFATNTNIDIPEMSTTEITDKESQVCHITTTRPITRSASNDMNSGNSIAAITDNVSSIQPNSFNGQRDDQLMPMGISQPEYPISTKIVKLSAEKKYTPLFEPILPPGQISTQENNIYLLASAAPTYSYRTTTPNNTDLNESGIQSMGGALKIGYHREKSRWKFETGLIYTQTGQQTKAGSQQSPIYTATAATTDISAIQLNKLLTSNSMGSMTNISTPFEDSNNLVFASSLSNTERVSASQSESSNLTLLQNLDYLEIPVTARYLIIQKLTNISVSMGLSSNILVSNSAVLKSNNQNLYNGQTINISNFSYSARLGLGVDVPIIKSLDLNIEPSLNCFITPINKENFRPYSFSVFTGLSYKF